MARSGDRCERCDGRLVKYSTRFKREEGIRVRYLKCNRCGSRPDDNKEIFFVDDLGRPIFLSDKDQKESQSS